MRGDVSKHTGAKFSYRDIKSVYTIVLFEKSPQEFHAYPENYYHFFEQKSDTGLKVELLQKYLFIPIDIFQKNKHNGRVMDMFSKELYELDKNTVQYMIDEMQETIDEQKSVIDKQKQEIDEMQEEHIKVIDEIQEEHIKAVDEMNVRFDKMQQQGIINTMKILQDLKVPEQEIKMRICEQYQISEEQVQQFFD